MTMRDRLAADLKDADETVTGDNDWYGKLADRLIALGWVRLDEEALAKALEAAWGDIGSLEGRPWDEQVPPGWQHRKAAAALIRALREEAGKLHA